MASARKERAQGRKRGKGVQAAREPAQPTEVGSGLRVFWLPLALTVGLALFTFVPRVAENPLLVRSFWGAALALLGFLGVLLLRVKGEGKGRALVLTRPRAQHYIQATVQLAVFGYWGYYWPPVYDFAWLLAAQLVFAYAFDMLLHWSRRERYILGFGPFPIIFSINLFLWFRDDWFYLQFLMIAVGFMGKEFVKWHREGRLTHIFNPSAFALGLFSLLLIATNTTSLTWGQEIATTLSIGPSIYLFLFLIGLVVMYFFSITLVVGSAAAVLFGLSALYSAWAGIPYFIDSEIPAAVFLGLHLLVTDPSTSPRSPLGRTVFGALYGLGVFVLYWLLSAVGVPTFYDKLLAVPLLNMSVQVIDGWARSVERRGLASRWLPTWAPPRMNLALMGVWIGFFALMASLGKADGRHVGDSLPFWEEACAEGRRTACERLAQIQYSHCADNSGWACNELGRHLVEGVIIPADPELALGYFARACELRFQPGCLNLLDPGEVVTALPREIDLRILVREKGRDSLEMSERDLLLRACEHGWTHACQRVAGIPG